jgi:hypothetical protein
MEPPPLTPLPMPKRLLTVFYLIPILAVPLLVAVGGYLILTSAHPTAVSARASEPYTRSR